MDLDICPRLISLRIFPPPPGLTRVLPSCPPPVTLTLWTLLPGNGTLLVLPHPRTPKLPTCPTDKQIVVACMHPDRSRQAELQMSRPAPASPHSADPYVLVGSRDRDRDRQRRSLLPATSSKPINLARNRTAARKALIQFAYTGRLSLRRFPSKPLPNNVGRGILHRLASVYPGLRLVDASGQRSSAAAGQASNQNSNG